MPEDNYVECMKAIAETMSGTGWVGEWYGKRLFLFLEMCTFEFSSDLKQKCIIPVIQREL